MKLLLQNNIKLPPIFISLSFFSSLYADFESSRNFQSEPQKIQNIKFYEDVTINRALEYLKIGDYDKVKYILEPMTESSIRVKELYERLFAKDLKKERVAFSNKYEDAIPTRKQIKAKQMNETVLNSSYDAGGVYSYRESLDKKHSFTKAFIPVNLDFYDQIFRHRYLKTKFLYLSDNLQNGSGDVELASMEQAISAAIGVEMKNFSLEVGITPVGLGIEPALTTDFSVFIKSEELSLGVSVVRFAMEDSMLSYVGQKKQRIDGVKEWGRILKGGIEVELNYNSYLNYNLDLAIYPYIQGLNIEENSELKAVAAVMFHTKKDEYTDLDFGFEGMYDAYDKNSYKFTYGHGGYFSPQNYFLGSFVVNMFRKPKSNYFWDLNAKVGYETYDVDDVYYEYSLVDALYKEEAYSETKLAYEVSYATGTRFNKHLDFIFDSSFKNMYNYYELDLGFEFVYFFDKQNKPNLYDFYKKQSKWHD